MQQETKQCQNCKNQFTIEQDDFSFYEKMKVPAPTWCPECRLQRRLAWINSRTLYSRVVDGKSSISMYAPEKEYNIVEDKKWWGDEFDFHSYGQEYDFSKPFFEQFNSLLKRVPLPHLQRGYATFENSDYCNAASYLKNCYLVFGADNSENVYYSNGIIKVKDSMDLTFADNSELCYENLMIDQCYSCLFCQDVENSNNLVFCQDCIGCSNCIGCFGLRNKSYCIFNKQYTKEEYQQKLKELNLSSFTQLEKLRNEAKNLFLSRPHKFMHGRNNKNISGDYIYNSKNVSHGFRIHNGENCKFVFSLDYLNGGTVNSYDFSWFGNNAELMYDAAWCGLGVSKIMFSVWNYNALDLQYCYGCHNSQSLFGCVGLRKKKYCIFNKQYMKEEYEELVPKIIQHMNDMPYVDKKGREYRYGEFFPVELSPFAYNETMASEYLQRTPEEVESLGYQWHERGERDLAPEISWKDLPDDIKDVGDDLVGKLILCRLFDENEEKALEHNCTKVFKLNGQEINFYRKLGAPLPRMCSNSRYHQRIKQLNPMKSWHRQCMCSAEHQHHSGQCLNEFETTYSPEKSEIVYCEQCYNAEVV